MGVLLMLKEGGSLAIDKRFTQSYTVDEDVDLLDFLKFVEYNGTQDNITIANSTLTFLEYNGTQDDISVINSLLKFTKADGTVDNINLI